MMEKITTFKHASNVDLHNKTIDEAIKILQDLKNSDKFSEYDKLRFILCIDWDDRPCLDICGEREETDKECEERIAHDEYLRKISEDNDKATYKRLMEKYPDGIPE
jgi:hypothetical protein